MFSESACQVSRRWDDVGRFYTRLFGVVYVTLGDFYDGSEKGTASVHQILCHLGKSATETLEMIQLGFGDQSLSRAQVFQWHARFKTGRTSVDDDECTGRPTSCTTPETVARIRQDRRLTIRDIAEEVEVGYGTCQRVLTEELGMHRVAAKFVPRILTADQKQQRVNICAELRQLPSNDETFLCRVTLVMRAGFTVTTLRQSDNPPSGKAPRHQGQGDCV